MKKISYTPQDSSAVFKRLLIVLFLIVGCDYSYAQTWTALGSAGCSSAAADYTAMAVDPSGTPYILFSDADNDGKATVLKYDGSGWINVGSAGFSAGMVSYTSIAIDGNGTPYVVYVDSSIGYRAVAKMFDGTDWVAVGGGGFSAGYTFYTSIAIDRSGTPYVAYVDLAWPGGANVKRFDGSKWVTVGSSFFNPNPLYTSIAVDSSGTPYVAFEDIPVGGMMPVADGPATVMKFDGSSWVTVGIAGFSTTLAQHTSIAIDPSGNPYVVYEEPSSAYRKRMATVMEFNGSKWVTVGHKNFSAGSVLYTTIAIDSGGIPYVVYMDSANQDRATVMKYNGAKWVTVGSAGFSSDTARNTAIAIGAGGVPYVVYTDFANSQKATVMKLDTGNTERETITSPGYSSLSIYPNPTHGSFTIKLTSPSTVNAQIIITNILGEKVKECTIAANRPVDLKLDATPGVYFLNAACLAESWSRKLIISP